METQQSQERLLRDNRAVNYGREPEKKVSKRIGKKY
jgi:hypothetical protein